MVDTNLIFVLGSGRCGTRMIYKLLSGVPSIEANHEFVRDFYQRDAALYYMGCLPYLDIARKLRELYESAAYYSEAKYFLDSTQKLAWVTNVLGDVFPKAKFVHLVRDGRKVVSSFYHKKHVYEDKFVRAQRAWKAGKAPMPPPNEEYWYPIPPEDYSHFQRICWHWRASNAAIYHSGVPMERFRLEDLSSDPKELERFLNYVDVDYDASFFRAMQKPQHVYVPVDFPLTEEQTEDFWNIAGDMMKTLGYEGKDEYRVSY